MARILKATNAVGEGVTFVGSDPSFGFMPSDVADILGSLHSIQYAESVSGKVTTGTLTVAGLGPVAAIRVTDEASGARHGIDKVEFVDGSDRTLLTLDEPGLPGNFDSTREALSAFLENYAQEVRQIYAAGNVITGTRFGDLAHGGGGADRIAGSGGKDNLFGDGGSDRVAGGAGNDRIAGGRGVDSLTGDAGADRFLFQSAADSGVNAQADTLEDYAAGSDKIDLRSVDANSKLAGKQGFVFVGDEAFDRKAGELRFDGHELQGDLDGDGRAEFEIHFGKDADVAGLAAGDLLL